VHGKNTEKAKSLKIAVDCTKKSFLWKFTTTNLLYLLTIIDILQEVGKSQDFQLNKISVIKSAALTFNSFRQYPEIENCCCHHHRD
jgi:hypothetical protein